MSDIFNDDGSKGAKKPQSVDPRFWGISIEDIRAELKHREELEEATKGLVVSTKNFDTSKVYEKGTPIFKSLGTPPYNQFAPNAPPGTRAIGEVVLPLPTAESPVLTFRLYW